MIGIQFDNKFDWLGIWFGISNNCGVWSIGVGKNTETNEEHDEDFVEEGFLLARRKFDKDGNGHGEALGMSYCISIFEMDQN